MPIANRLAAFIPPFLYIAISAAARFDCNNAGTLTERAICASSQLSALDDQMVQSYKDALANAGDRNALTVSQRLWLRQKRNPCQDDTVCLRQAYIARIAEFAAPTSPRTALVPVERRGTIIRAAVEAAYSSGRGQLRLRARWEVEKRGQGTYQVVVTEIPYQVQKSRLIERIAQLLQDKKLALLADVRDESAEDVRIVLEPKSRNVDPAVLMESLFRQTELETRFGLNMNVLDGKGIPRVMSLREVLQAFLDHRHEVLICRSKFRLAAIETRLEVLDGYLIAYLNIDAVIRIIRKEDDRKTELMKRFKLSEPQTEAILNMRLRALNKLSEIESKREHDALSQEKKDLARLLKDEDRRWQRIGEEIGDIRRRFGAKAPTSRVVPRIARVWAAVRKFQPRLHNK